MAYSKARQCEVCGSKYAPSYGRQRTCGRACGAKIRRHSPMSPDARARVRAAAELRRAAWPTCTVWVRNCTTCGVLYVARFRGKVTCSRPCQERGRRERLGMIKLSHCQVAGHPVPAGRRKCDGCIAATRRELKRRGRRKRRAVKRGIPHDPYTLLEIALRDKQRCGLCGQRVAMKQRVPSPKAPTIDHVVPLSCNGEDTRANVQLAHFVCNSRKRNGGSQQLALVG